MTVGMQAGQWLWHEQLTLNTAHWYISGESWIHPKDRVSEMPWMLLTAWRGIASKKRLGFVLTSFILPLIFPLLKDTYTLTIPDTKPLKNIKYESIN